MRDVILKNIIRYTNYSITRSFWFSTLPKKHKILDVFDHILVFVAKLEIGFLQVLWIVFTNS